MILLGKKVAIRIHAFQTTQKDKYLSSLLVLFHILLFLEVFIQLELVT